MSEEQQITEPFTIMVCTFMCMIDCLATVSCCENNWLFSCRTVTMDKKLPIMVAVFYHVTLKKLLYAYGIHYTVTTGVWFLVHANHKFMVFS